MFHTGQVPDVGEVKLMTPQGFNHEKAGHSGSSSEACDCLSHNGFLTAKGLEETAQRKHSLYGVDARELSLYVDSRVSVSGLRRDEDMYDLISDISIDEQARRFHHGS